MRSSPSLTEGSILRAMITLSVPIVIANILQTAYQITDTFWVGRLSADAVAAVSVSFPLNFLLIAIGGGLPIAGTVLIAQYRGRGDTGAMNHVAAQTFLMVITVSILLSVLGYVFSEQIMRLMDTPPEILADATAFARISFIGFVFVFGFFVFESLMRGLGKPNVPMLIVFFTVLLNFFLDPLFIFGWGPVPEMGVSGAAMATVITQAVALLIGGVLLFRGTHGIHLQWKDFRPDFPFMKRAFKLGFPSSVEQSTRALGFTVMTILVAGFGTATLAAYGIGIRVLTFIIIPAMGLSIATSTLVAQNLGAGKPERAVRTNTLGSIVSFVSLTLGGLLLYPLAETIATLFIPEGGDVIAQSGAFVRIMALTFGFIGVQMILLGSLRGAGDTRASMVITLVSQWAMQFPLAYLLSQHTSLGLEGIWWSFAISNVLSTVFTAIWFARSNWQHKKLLEDEELKRAVEDESQMDEGLAA
jgi:putative MATE family efflux protein